MSPRWLGEPPGAQNLRSPGFSVVRLCTRVNPGDGAAESTPAAAGQRLRLTPLGVAEALVKAVRIRAGASPLATAVVAAARFRAGPGDRRMAEPATGIARRCKTHTVTIPCLNGKCSRRKWSASTSRHRAARAGRAPRGHARAAGLYTAAATHRPPTRIACREPVGRSRCQTSVACCIAAVWATRWATIRRVHRLRVRCGFAGLRRRSSVGRALHS
jgi:hypothetical protein